MAGERIKAGMIGLGSISELHMPPLKMMDNVRLMAFSDILRERAVAASRSHGSAGSKVYEDYRELLANPEIEVVHIATPHDLHAQIALDALQAGKYVLLEKPMDATLAGSRALMAADQDGRFGVVYQNRYNASVSRAKQVIESGELGALQSISAFLTWKRDAGYYEEAPWRGERSRAGGGVLMTQAIHTIDLLYHLGGPFAAVKGSVSRDFNEAPIDVEDNAHAVIRHEDGKRSLLYASISHSRDEDPTIRLYFEEGSLTLRGEMLYKEAGGERIVLVKPESFTVGGRKAVYGRGHLRLIHDFYHCIATGRRFAIDAREAYPSVWAVLSIYESSEKGQWIEFQ